MTGGARGNRTLCRREAGIALGVSQGQSLVTRCHFGFVGPKKARPFGRPQIAQSARSQKRKITDIGLPECIAIIYTIRVIKSFRHKGVEQFFRTGSKAKIQPNHAERLRKQLFALDNAKSPKDMNAPGWRLHPLLGELQGHWAVDVSGNWRLTFAFEGENAVLVDYRDYH